MGTVPGFKARAALDIAKGELSRTYWEGLTETVRELGELYQNLGRPSRRDFKRTVFSIYDRIGADESVYAEGSPESSLATTVTDYGIIQAKLLESVLELSIEKERASESLVEAFYDLPLKDEVVSGIAREYECKAAVIAEAYGVPLSDVALVGGRAYIVSLAENLMKAAALDLPKFREILGRATGPSTEYRKPWIDGLCSYAHRLDDAEISKDETKRSISLLLGQGCVLWEIMNGETPDAQFGAIG
jgi:hypothetical protein